MKRVQVGIHVYEMPEQFRRTLDSLRANTASPIDVLLLPDGPDPPTAEALSQLGDLPQSGTTEPKGAPACFNRLIAASDADLVVLIESGSIVGPGWLEHLQHALNAHSSHGLGGPSTNRAWNEQSAFPEAGGSPVEVAYTAYAAAQRFGRTWRTLEPLHSLADFCYAVRREVIDIVGTADEAYGLGPCWEMDYNIRAARAGFEGVWACGAYVYRSPVTARRHREEAARFDAGKQWYQRKFCALHLRQERTDYEPHCRGDQCEHFAPHALIQIYSPALAGESTLAEASKPPLVSCVMATSGRGDFLPQSVRYFQRQDYPLRELVIVDDGPEDLSGSFSDVRVRYYRFPSRLSIGAKRNVGCRMAQGNIIVQWDDDDWYGQRRLSLQAAPLIAGAADITALTADVFFDVHRWEFWTCTPELHRRLFLEDVHGGTLAYHRRVWEQFSRYPDASLAEDAAFLRQAVSQGARLVRLSSHGQFIYVRHGLNAWAFECGRHVDPYGWRRLGEPPLDPSDLAFYVSIPPVSAAQQGALDAATCERS